MPWLIPEHITLPHDFIGFDPHNPTPPDGFSHYERHLPHWRLQGACYFVTFRLDDSMPKGVEMEMRREAELWRLRLARVAARHEGRLPPEESVAWEEFQRTRLRKLERLLDEGHGECVLRELRHRAVVEQALRHFEGDRCEMLAHAIMPNHAHVLCRPLKEHQLEDLCGSWKWFTAQKIQRNLGRTGPLWQEENFDRIIRDAEHYANTTRYIARNPMKAGLGENEASVWFCEAIRKANQSP